MRECQVFHFRFLLLFALVLSIGFTACSSQSLQTHIARGEEYLQKRKFQEAVMEFRAAAEMDKTSAEAHWGLARSFENLGQFHETVEALRQTAELNPDNLEAKTKLGNYILLAEPPQIAETERILADVFARDANFVEGYILKASILTAQRRSEKDILDVLNYAPGDQVFVPGKGFTIDTIFQTMERVSLVRLLFGSPF